MNLHPRGTFRLGSFLCLLRSGTSLPQGQDGHGAAARSERLSVSFVSPPRLVWHCEGYSLHAHHYSLHAHHSLGPPLLRAPLPRSAAQLLAPSSQGFLANP